MGASKIQLFSLGPQDYHLTANPQITFFKSVFRRYTNFAIDTKRIHFQTDTPTFGSQNATAKITNEGDLLGDMYLELSISGTSNEKGVYTINHFGNYFVKKANFEIGGFVIDTLYPQWLQIHKELNNKNRYPPQPVSGLKGGKYTNLNFNSDIGATVIDINDRISGDCPLVFGGNIRNNNLGVDYGSFTKKICIPLPFWFTKAPGLHLPICAINNHELLINFDFEEKAICELYI